MKSVIWSVQGISLDRQQSQILHLFSRKKTVFLHTGAACFEIPSNISTMVNNDMNSYYDMDYDLDLKGPMDILFLLLFQYPDYILSVLEG